MFCFLRAVHRPTVPSNCRGCSPKERSRERTRPKDASTPTGYGEIARASSRPSLRSAAELNLTTCAPHQRRNGGRSGASVVSLRSEDNGLPFGRITTSPLRRAAPSRRRCSRRPGTRGEPNRPARQEERKRKRAAGLGGPAEEPVLYYMCISAQRRLDNRPEREEDSPRHAMKIPTSDGKPRWG